jgi:DNA-binding CsgD family transcriptional regulator
VDLVTGNVVASDEEREILRRGDSVLLSVLKTGYNKKGRKITTVYQNKPAQPYQRLTKRERDVAKLILQGCKIDEAAEILGILPGTAYIYMRDLRIKTEERFTWRAALMACVWGWLEDYANSQ